MLHYTSNLEAVLRKALAATKAAAAVAQSQEVDRAMRRGIQSHFNRLSSGGGSDSTALANGSDTTTRVRWRNSRHPFTVRAHRASGVDPDMLLIHTGGMRDAFTVGALVDGRGLGHGWGSDATLRGGTPDAVEKARRNRGGVYRTDFPRIAERNVLMLFPDRQFVYWDTEMRDEVARVAARAAEKEWSA